MCALFKKLVKGRVKAPKGGAGWGREGRIRLMLIGCGKEPDTRKGKMVRESDGRVTC